MMKWLGWLWLLVGLVGCTSAANNPNDPWTVDLVLSERENTEVAYDIVDINNCGQVERQNVYCPAGDVDSFTYDTSATGMQRALIQASVLETLPFNPDAAANLALEAPPDGSVYRYHLIKVYRTIRGEAVARSESGQRTTINYTFLAECNVSIQKRDLYTCGTDLDSTPPTQSQIPTLSLPTSTPTPFVAVLATPTPTPTAAQVVIDVLGTPTPGNCQFGPAPEFAALWAENRALIGCPVAIWDDIPVLAEESFEGGHLFWRNDTEALYIVLDRDKVTGQALFSGRWQLTPDSWRWDGSSPDGIGLNPPPGRVEPKRGFGWLWRTHLGRENGPLGWALDREYGFENIGLAQDFERGLMFRGSSRKVYLLLDDNRFIAR